MGFISDLSERRIFRFVVAYGAASWAGLELVDQLVGNDLLPQAVYFATLSLVLCGFPGALIVSWFHGAKGRQEMPRVEKWLLAGVAVFALGTTGFVVRETDTAAGAGLTRELAPTEDPRRVAVLYLDVRGGGDAEFLASGLTETLIDQLSEVQGLHVVSRNGSQLFRGVAVSADSIGRALQVGVLVNGTVALAGDRVRVDVGLTNVSTGEQFASRRLERARTEIFALQDELGDTVSVFLRRAIGEELGARRLRLGTESARAWELVQQAAREADGSAVLAGTGDLEAASRSLMVGDSLLGLAEAADPAWLEPVVRRGWLAYRQSRLGGMDRAHNETWIERGLAHAERALTEQPKDAAALELRATLVYWRFLLNLAGTPAEADRLFHMAEGGFRAAIAAAGGSLPSAQNSLSHLLMNKGAPAEAKLNALQAYVADPFLENAHLTLWRIFLSSWSLQDGIEARRYCDEGLRRFAGDFRFQQCQLMLAGLPGSRPDIPQLWSVLDQFAAMSPAQVRDVNRRRGMMYLSMALVRAGLPDSARSVARSARVGSDIDPLRELAQLESITQTWLGDVDEAVRLLSLYLSANPGALDGLRADAERRELPWYHQSLIDEPAFRSLVGAR